MVIRQRPSTARGKLRRRAGNEDSCASGIVGLLVRLLAPIEYSCVAAGVALEAVAMGMALSQALLAKGCSQGAAEALSRGLRVIASIGSAQALTGASIGGRCGSVSASMHAVRQVVRRDGEPFMQTSRSISCKI
eukprot:4601680-Prymnesium_polylepis.1